MEIARILCPVEPSPESRGVLDQAIWLARVHRAALSVLHVHHLELVPSGDGEPTVPDLGTTGTLSQRQQADLRLGIDAFVTDRTRGLHFDMLLDEHPSISDAIVERAAAIDADLVVIGTGHDARKPEAHMSSIAERVVHAVSCSVLTVPGNGPATSIAPPSRIVCPIDFSASSILALMHATSLAQTTSAQLAVVHVVNLSEIAGSAYDFDAHREARIEPARELTAGS